MGKTTDFKSVFSLVLSFLQLVTSENGSPPFIAQANVSYGIDPQQIMDVYLPTGRNSTVSKVILLIHGGGWAYGRKEVMNGWAAFFFYTFPQHVVINMGYRLGTIKTPGFSKQIDDIREVISFVKSKAEEWGIDPKFGLVGVSAGAHLSMLYGYRYDSVKDVKVICNIVGPSSLVDPSYTKNRFYDFLFYPLVGNYTFVQNPNLYSDVSPVTWINFNAPKTISFYGDKDTLIPSSQGTILEDKLDSVGVYNKFYLYAGGGHTNFTAEQNAHMYKKIPYFFKNYL